MSFSLRKVSHLSVEQFVRLVLQLLVRHLLQPRLLQVLFAQHFLLVALRVLSLLDRSGVSQVGDVLSALILAALLSLLSLLLQLLLDSVVLPVDLLLVGLVHVGDDFLGLLRAEVRFVVLLLDVLVLCNFLVAPVHLHRDVLLVQLLIGHALFVGLTSLSFVQLDVVDELALFLLSEVLQAYELLFVTAQSLQRSLVGHCHLGAILVQLHVSQLVVVHRERSLALEEHRHLSVVARANRLAVKRLLDRAQQVTLGASLLRGNRRLRDRVQGFYNGSLRVFGHSFNIHLRLGEGVVRVAGQTVSVSLTVIQED